jgi:hypothetical protein
MGHESAFGFTVRRFIGRHRALQFATHRMIGSSTAQTLRPTRGNAVA